MSVNGSIALESQRIFRLIQAIPGRVPPRIDRLAARILGESRAIRKSSARAMVNGRYVGLQKKCRLGLLALRARRPRPISSSRLSPRGVPDQPHNDQKLMKLANPLSNPLMGMGESAWSRL